MWGNEDINHMKLDSLPLTAQKLLFNVLYGGLGTKLTSQVHFNKKNSSASNERVPRVDEESFVIRNHKNYAKM